MNAGVNVLIHVRILMTFYNYTEFTKKNIRISNTYNVGIKTDMIMLVLAV
jgi:hypothetical protein